MIVIQRALDRARSCIAAACV